jgi:DNA repair protein RecN (Recombination protein N)
VDLHGPHDHQSLFSPERQLGLLDSYAHNADLLRQYTEAYRKLQTLRTEHAALNTAEAVRAQEIDLLRHQIGEITNANLIIAEEDEIAARYRLGSNSKRLVELAGSVAGRLVEADNSILSQLAETQRLLRELEKIDPEQATLSEAHAACVVELTEISRSLAEYAEKLDLDPAQLAALEERVNLFESLKRKYGGSIAEVIAFGERAAERLAKIEGRDAELQRLNGEIEGASAEVDQIGAGLRKVRAKAAPKLAASVRAGLEDLGFRQSEFEAKLTSLEQPGRSGLDGLELLFSPNPGEPLKPLRLIASSGEISRLMLAIKSSLAEQDAIPLLVFDEIDANVGGEVANAVGGKMRDLAKDHQVLCITHLPQVAAAAATQFVVTKEVLQNRTHSRLTEVRGKARQEEIARMLGGKTESALKHAATLLRPG